MSEVQTLTDYVNRLYESLLKIHVEAATLIPSIKEKDSVKAFCVLAHAAVEEYFEKLVWKMIQKSCDKYQTNAFVSVIPSSPQEVDELNLAIKQLLKTLILSNSYAIYSKKQSEGLKKYESKLESIAKKGGQSLTEEEIENFTKRTDSYVREILKETKIFFDDHVADNHGASLKYVLKLFVPAGIDVPNETSLLNSLQQLSKYRGEYAHKANSVTTIVSTQDIKTYIDDVIELCRLIESQLIVFNRYFA